MSSQKLKSEKTFDKKVHDSWITKAKKLKERMGVDQKQKLLVGLRKLREQDGNIGGTTDIVNADNLQVSENEFTSGDSQPVSKVIAKTFDTEADFDSYVNQRRGIEMTPKELQSVSVMAEAAVPQQNQQMPPQPKVHQKNQQMPQPKAPQPSRPNPQPQAGEEAEDTTAEDKIRVQKSNTFVDDTQGADILSNFLSELELFQEKPTHADKFFMRYELTDDFGNNTTTVIKKLKEGNQFCWTAFSKYESAEEEGNPESKEEEEK